MPDGFLPGSKRSTDPLQTSLAAWAAIIEQTECADFLRFCGHALSGSHRQSDQCRALAQIVPCTPETARLWLTYTSQPSWPSMFAVFVATRARFESDEAMRAAFLGGV